MTVRTHSPDALARFQDGETRLVFARYRNQPELTYLLPDGQARQLRAWAKQDLECLMPDCADRRLTTVSRSDKGRRDGFAHMPGAGKHSPESLFHVQAKRCLERWVHTTYPELTVQLEAPVGTERIADVLVTSRTPPGLLAFEVQYSTLGVEQWSMRHASYDRLGVHDVWLLGHAGRHLRTNEYGLLQRSELQRQILGSGSRLLWINPVDETVATAVVDPAQKACGCGYLHGSSDGRQLPAGPDDEVVRLVVDNLAECRLAHGRFLTPALAAAEAAEQLWQAARDRDHQANADAAALAEAAAPSTSIRPRQPDKALAPQLQQWWEPHRDRLEVEWNASAVRLDVLSTQPPYVQELINGHDEWDAMILTWPDLWHALILLEHVRGRPVGYRFGLSDAIITIQDAGIPVYDNLRLVAWVVQRFLAAVEKVDLISHGESGTYEVKFGPAARDRGRHPVPPPANPVTEAEWASVGHR